MSNEVTNADVSQALSQLLVDVAAGRNVNKTQLDRTIAASDATVRRMQSHINAVKTMIECKKHGVDFGAAMLEIRKLDTDASQDFRSLLAKPISEG